MATKSTTKPEEKPAEEAPVEEAPALVPADQAAALDDQGTTADTAGPNTTPPEEAIEETLITLKHEKDTGDYILAIGERQFEVTGGIVKVAADLLDAAIQSGFRAA